MESRELIVAFEGDQVADDADRVYFISTVITENDYENEVVQIVYEDSKKNKRTSTIPYFNFLKVEQLTQLYKIIAQIPYSAFEIINAVSFTGRENSNYGLNGNIDKVLKTDFKHKEIQGLLALYILNHNFYYPEWFVNAMFEKEDELSQHFQNVHENYNNHVNKENWARKERRIMFSRSNSDEDKNFKRLSQPVTRYETVAHFEIHNLISTWLFSGDPSKTFGEAVDEGFTMNYVDPVFLTPENNELAITLADTLYKDMLEQEGIDFNSYDFEPPKNIDVIKQLKSSDMFVNRPGLFDLTAFEAFAMAGKLLNSESVTKLKNKNIRREMIVGSVIIHLSYGPISISKAYGTGIVKDILSKYPNEDFYKLDEEYSGLPLEAVDTLVEWDKYCTEGSYMPWKFYHMLHDDSDL